MEERIATEITGPSAWVGPEIQNDEGLIQVLGDGAVADIERALRHAQKAGVQIPFTKQDFPLSDMAGELDDIIDEVRTGRGFCVLRGIPRERYSDAECELIYWGLGAHIGTPVSQNARGHLLGHVLDEGRLYEDPMARGYQSSERMDFHLDLLPVDVLGLFCLRQAKSGGASHLVSSLTVHNVLRRERPDYLETLYRPFYLDWRGEEPAGEQPWYSIPMVSAKDGQITSRFCSRSYYQSCERFGEAYALTAEQTEALDFVQEVANRPELRVSLRLEEGDIEFVNNHTIMHARDAFVDYDEPHRRRHLLRMWIGLPDDRRRPLSPALDGRYRWVKNGGIPAKTMDAAAT